MECIDTNIYTAAQLREWLKRLGLPTHGNKSALAIRLGDVPAVERGDCPSFAGEEVESVGVGESPLEETAERDLETQNELLTKEVERLKLVIVQLGSSSVVGGAAGVTERDDSSNGRASSVLNGDVTNVSATYNRQANIQHATINSGGASNDGGALNNGSSASNDGGALNNGSSALNDGGALKDNDALNSDGAVGTVRNEKDSATVRSVGAIPLEMVKDLLPEYEGGPNFNIWIQQLRSAGKVFNLDHSALRAVMISKLKGSARVWLHARPLFITENIDSLVAEMQAVFAPTHNKLLLRKQFEARKWSVGETFQKYYNEKVLLSDLLNMDECELIDHIVEGMPDEQLRNQAYIQCYTTRVQLLQAFGRVELKRDSMQMPRTNVKCFNCNSFGHMAVACRKPKREVGACYGCGSMEHKVATCPTRIQNNRADESPYNAS
ncbi:uncharacterized protein LOC125776637 [Bactrocera dorsalis]|uniref:Uncharacterized protein LOC125776637 n=1 Tax=Bactrocera dorsalis TaxID=27457 RepID=A0ABM3J9Y7_BACDO|nr:uncharacterized protein LOC125776637 [Bactrocera dorsalis]